MRTLYQACSGIEAHMILNLLEQQGLSGRVDGEFLQGAIGELPAAGLVKVMVAEEDYEAARRIVAQWEAAQPVNETPPVPVPQTASNKAGYLMLGLALGLLLAYGYYRAPVAVNGVDYNGDGANDEHWTYSPGGRVLKNEVDRNLDGKIDAVWLFGDRGELKTGTSDNDFDGVFEARATFLNGSADVTETDTDGDGYYEYRVRFTHGVLTSSEHINPGTGLPQKIEYYRLDKLTHADSDTNLDGKMDQRTTFDALGAVVSVRPL